MDDNIAYDQQYRATVCTSKSFNFVFTWNTTNGLVSNCTMYNSTKNESFEFDRENLQKLGYAIYDFLYSANIDVSLSDKIVRSHNGTITVKREIRTIDDECLFVSWIVESNGKQLVADTGSLRITKFDTTRNVSISEWRITSRWATNCLITERLDGVPEMLSLIKKLIKVMKPQSTTPSIWNRLGKRISSMFSSRPYSVDNITTKDDYIIIEHGID